MLGATPAAVARAGRLSARRRPWRAPPSTSYALTSPWLRALSSAAPAPLRIDDAHVVRSQRLIQFPEETLPDLVWGRMARWPDKVAVECGVTGRRLTYAQLRDAARRLAVALRSPRLLGPRRPEEEGARGADAAVLMHNAPEFAAVLLGAAEAGAVLSTVNPTYTPEEVARQLADSGARLLFADAGRIAQAQAALAQLKRTGPPLPLVRVGPGDAPPGVLRFEELTGSGAPLYGVDLPEVSPDDVAVLPYSSGTTGLPKGVLLTHRHLCSCMRQMQHPAVALAKETEGDVQDIIPAVLPFFHIYGMTVVLMNSLSIGAQVISLPKFDPQTFIHAMIEKKGTGLYAAPPLVLFLADHPDVPPAALQSLRFVNSGAAPLAAADAERLRARAQTSVGIVQGYGLTEASPTLTLGTTDNVAAVGAPMPATEGVIVDLKTGVSLPHGREGELCFRGPQVMKGYWRRPEDTAATLAPGGWLRTGDVGLVDERGHFVIRDRAKELIKVKGFQVAPAELEGLLRAHPAVAEAAVVGLPDARAGELPCAFVVTHQPPADAAAARELRAALAAHVASQTARHKHLAAGVRLVAAIPKNASGKILRRQVREVPPPEILP